MFNGFDLSTISAIYVGSTSYSEIYYGSVKIWPVGLPIGTTYNFDYTGTVLSQELPAGTYKLQVWGAQGGSSTGSLAATGSKGGYSEGILTLASTTTLYIFVGGAGESIAISTSTTVVNGGWNGGGGAKPYNSSGSGIGRRRAYPRPGGGATDIALVTSTMDYSSNRTNRSSDSLLSRIIVAGGGGGSSAFTTNSSGSQTLTSTGTGVGGGTSGGSSYPGTQSSAGTGGGLGYGANQSGTASYLGGAGGGGWYGGGTSSSSSASLTVVNYGSGGSGFVNTAENAQYRPTGYTGLELDSGATYAGNTSFPSTSGSTETGHEGNGYARITCVDGKKFIPLTFNILSDGTITWNARLGGAKTIQYRKNNGEWTSITASSSTSISVTTGDVLQFKGNNSSYGTLDGGTIDTYNAFSGSASFNVRGNIMSLCGYTDILTDEAVFPYLFESSKVVDASGLLLPTNVTAYCYTWMFRDCTSLTTAPELPATTLAERCYWAMFYGCTSLTTAPELLVGTLSQGCYSYMFYGCRNLNYIKCLATDISASNCTSNWVERVAATGTFVAHPSTDWTTGNDGIPTNWNVQPVDVPLSEQYLTFDILGDGTIGWKVSNSYLERTIQYKKNYGSWTSITSSTSTSGRTISVSSGDVVQFRGSATAYGDSGYYNCFTATCNFNVKGNIMSMFSSTGFESLTTIPTSYAFKGLFYGNTYLKDASALLMPATTLTTYCYQNMFYGCTNMTGVPVLPATTITNYCYYRMFYNCSNITTAPALNAATIATSCYYQMFYGCTKLNYIKCFATNISATNCTSNWVYGVAATGTFVKAASMTSWSTGTNGIPSGWTVEDAS